MLQIGKMLHRLFYKMRRFCFNSVLKEFTKILYLPETYWRPIGGLSDNHRRLTCLLGDPLEFKHMYLNIVIAIYFLLIYIGIMLGQTCWSLMGLLLDMSVFDQECCSPIMHVGLR